MATPVYLAGKIGKMDWRHSIFPGLRSVTAYEYGAPPGATPHVTKLGLEDDLERDGFEYAGPFFMGCDHGCGHGPHNHGLGVQSPGCIPDVPPADVVRWWCERWLVQSRVVFCWLSEPDAYGSLVELGMARAHETPIFLAYPSHNREDQLWSDTWFARSVADACIRARDAEEAWRQFVRWWPEWRPDGSRIRPRMGGAEA